MYAARSALLECPLHLCPGLDHLCERRIRTVLGPLPGEQGLETEAQRLDLLELLERELARHTSPRRRTLTTRPSALEAAKRRAGQV